MVGRQLGGGLVNVEEKLSSGLILGEILARNARKYPNKNCLVIDEHRATFDQLNRRTNQLAQGLIMAGVKKGERVGLLMNNCFEIIECFMASCKLGAVSVPVNARLGASEIKYILNHSDCTVLFSHNDLLSRIEGIRKEISSIRKYIGVGPETPPWAEPYESFVRDTAGGEPLVLVEDGDEAFIIYTSGTTGRPKGAVLTHKNLWINIATAALEYRLMFEDCYLISAPLFHVAALTGLLIFWFVGATNIFLSRFDPRKTMETIESERVTVAFGVPSMWFDILALPDLGNFDNRSLRYIWSGGAPLPLEVKKKLKSRFQGVQSFDIFGQTELCGAAVILKPKDYEKKQASVGLPMATVEIKVVDDNDHDVKTGEVGEIVYRGPTVMKEYYKDPEATMEAMRGGWFHSGDLVRRDNEGFVWVVDRKNDMIISGGENIYPAEIEEVLYTHPKVKEVAVVGARDERLGEIVRAFVVVREGGEMTEDEVIEFCKSNLASYKKPRRVDFLEELPKNAVGKVLKTNLRYGPV